MKIEIISIDEAKRMAISRNCKCVKGKDRDNNYIECIDNIYDSIINNINIKLELAKKKRDNNFRIIEDKMENEKTRCKAWGKYVAYSDLVRYLNSIIIDLIKI